jgi:bifunctional DNA-binding transcriptional regulator/antitoxin component of YhaV-PrlF toxin-antitoxin module
MPTLMIRKLIAMGEGGLVVTVPKAWWSYYGLKAGDEVIVIANGELTIQPKTISLIRRVSEGSADGAAK